MPYGRNIVRTWKPGELMACEALMLRAPKPQPSRPIPVIACDWMPSDTIILRGPKTVTVLMGSEIRTFERSSLVESAVPLLVK